MAGASVSDLHLLLRRVVPICWKSIHAIASVAVIAAATPVFAQTTPCAISPRQDWWPVPPTSSSRVPL